MLNETTDLASCALLLHSHGLVRLAFLHGLRRVTAHLLLYLVASAVAGAAARLLEPSAALVSPLVRRLNLDVFVHRLGLLFREIKGLASLSEVD